MKPSADIRVFAAVLAVGALLVPSLATAQREVNWQINAKEFPENVSIFADVSDTTAAGASYNPNLKASAFAVSIDEFAGDQGGAILNPDQPNMRGGKMGGQVLIMIDKSRSYTGEFDKAKKMAQAIANGLNPATDEVAVATFPTGTGYSESKLELNFTSDRNLLKSAIGAIEPMPKGDETGARFCDALAEGLKYFPQKVNNKYRVVVFLTAGADKGEGKGNCVKDSYAAGRVPFYSMVFKLDKKYDDPRNAHKIENGCLDLAKQTSGRSIFRRSEGEMAQFIGMMWNRIRSQYYFQVLFPCYNPAPYIEHTSVLKVEGQDADGIKYEAASKPSPVPTITAIYPPQAFRDAVDDGVDVTVDGTGFCGGPKQVSAAIGGAQVTVKSQMPFRVVLTTHSGVESGTVKVVNRFGESGESPMKLEVVEPPKGAEASKTLMVIVIVAVALAVLAVLIVALKSRKAKVPAGAPPSAPSAAPPSPSAAPSAPAPKTVAFDATSNVWLVRASGARIPLAKGDNLIGREAHCRVKLEIPGVSREHAKIDVDPATGKVFAADLGSTNGTFWGPPDATEAQLIKLDLQRRELAPGDTIWIGGEKMTIVFEAGASREG